MQTPQNHIEGIENVDHVEIIEIITCCLIFFFVPHVYLKYDMELASFHPWCHPRCSLEL
jgi:hypothetical protein